MVEEVAKTKAGVACIVDAGHPDMGRDVDFHSPGINEVRRTDRGGRRVLHAAVLSYRNFDDEREEQIVKALIKQADDNTMGVFGEIGVVGRDDRG